MRTAILVAAILAMAAGAAADEVRLTNGQVVVGRIVRQTSAFVTIETMLNGKRATLTYSRTQIRSVMRGEIPDSFFEAPEEPSPAPPPRPATETEPEATANEGDEEVGAAPPPGPAGDAVRYMVVPLKGGVGREITARGVRDALRLAKRQRLNAVVFVIETDGGLVADADAIARVMDEERGELKYYAVVSKAISAGIWPLSRADRIFFEPGGIAGSAVAYSASSTGEVAVDAKFNAAIAAGLASAAEARGQSGHIYRAMVLMEASLYHWRDADGTVRVSASRPPHEVVGPVEMVSPTAVLALTAKQAAEIGFAVELPSKELSAIGPLIGAAKWEAAAAQGLGPMLTAQREIERRQKAKEDAEKRILELRAQVVDLARQAPTLRDAALSADPSRITVYYRDGTGTLSPESQLKWRKQTDEAVGKWNDFLALLGRIRSAERSAERAVDHYNNCRAKEWEARLYDEAPEPVEIRPVEHGLDLDRLYREAEEKKAQLLSRRMRTNVAR